jgi:hypothetical protein
VLGGVEMRPATDAVFNFGMLSRAESFPGVVPS